MRYLLLVPAAALLVACGSSDPSADSTVIAAAPRADVVPAAAPGTPAPALPSNDSLPVAVMYKDANCDCCAKWGDHLRANGFSVVSNDVTDLPAVKRRHGVPASLQSCHTAEIGGYIVEGHVPADLIVKMLRERPAIAGIAVPGMPVGSPGMEWTYTEPYDVIAFTRSGATSVYASR